MAVSWLRFRPTWGRGFPDRCIRYRSPVRHWAGERAALSSLRAALAKDLEARAQREISASEPGRARRPGRSYKDMAERRVVESSLPGVNKPGDAVGRPRKRLRE